MAPTDSPRSHHAQQLWSIALPAMLTNVATALFGLADMWAIGRLGDASAQGAVELGAKFMLGLLNIFNFLRTSTVALTAQSTGRGETGAGGDTLARAIAAAAAIGILLLTIMPWVIPLGLDFLHASVSVRPEAQTYISIRYWSAPIWLANCVLVGWLIGRRKVRWVLYVEIGANLFHIALDLLLVLVLPLGVAGVAIATISSEALKFVLLIAIVVQAGAAKETLAALKQRATWGKAQLLPLFALNRDLFIRTLLLTGSLLIFARNSAQAGPVALAANGILFQLFMLATLLLDGFESAAQVLCGEAAGAKARDKFIATVKASLLWGALFGLLLSVLYAVIGARLASAFSTDTAVIETVRHYAPWLALLPILGIASFVFDGVFIGAGWTRAMLSTMTFATSIYIILLYALPPMGNHGLWFAFAALFATRAIGQALCLPRLIQRSFTAY